MADDYTEKEVGTIYVKHPGSQWEVWFEDFNIIGIGLTRVEALQDAIEHCEQLGQLVKTALATEPAQAASGGEGCETKMTYRG